MTPWIFGQDDAAHGEPAWRWLADWVAMPALLATPSRPLGEMDEPASRLSDALREKFVELLGARRVKQTLDERARHGGSSTADRLRLRNGDLSRLPDAVLYPRNPDDVLALLKLCAAAGVAVTPFGSGSGLGALATRGTHQALVSFDLSAMSHLLSVDGMAGLARAEAGLTADELARQLAAHGMMLKGTMQGTVGGHIARNRQVPWLQAVKFATPEGVVASGLPFAPGSNGALGIITSASLRIQAVPARTEYRRYLFTDFASGLTALREAQRQGLIRAGACLSDAGATRFLHQMEQMSRGRSLMEWLADIYRHLRRFDNNAAGLTIGFSGSEAEADAARKRFDALAKRLGALAQGVSAPATADYRDLLLDHGLTMDAIETTASWSRLPRIYAAMRANLDRTMRAQVPRNGAHGLVLAQISDVSHEGGRLRLTMIYPRILGSDVAQAEAVRNTALNALRELTDADEPLEEKLRAAVKQTLDPKGILNPGKAPL
ncbi:MAG TPA: FAD-binding oxidoreductase [Rhizomicrobium sp.]|nr:FAD-binding oxidoreductase [Rhizomicrobium sp.]